MEPQKNKTGESTDYPFAVSQAKNNQMDVGLLIGKEQENSK
jgi:hypothetical protein